ncbi:MAG: Wzz/FepE/Etk N-terminal domain-containing protein [Clostridium sp.]|uniref:YveK family protein n=1 Tax=Clostridium sp. TaxID=1506 RepID=UPI002A75E2D6|nr:Wzz/FepE/Etk N-terminal domain-containing protein [Clostridium sp.]MDY2630712.1 Wzz/FepE/Etk N-terminal domain-containing protein [Clostridium sp.]
MEDQMISLEELFEALKKRWLMIVCITLIATMVSATLSFFVIKPKYEANTKVFIGKEEGENKAYNQGDVIMYQQLMKTYSETIKTKDLISKALKEVGLKLKVEDVLRNLTVVTVADTQILEVKYKCNSPQEAKVVIEGISDEFIKTSKELVPNGNIQVIESVELPEKPVSPNKKMNIALAFLLGLMVGAGLVFLLEFLDNTFKNKEQLERAFEIPVIGSIPTVKES